MSDQKISGLDACFKLLYLILPLLFLIFGGYFAFFNMMLRNNILKTTEDLSVITEKMAEAFNGKYPALNSSVIFLSNVLPYDYGVKKTPMGYDFSNRFGGKMFFYNAYNTVTERSSQSEILGSYIILFTRLTKKECEKLAQTNWHNYFPNFLGLEASYLTAQKSFNGVYNLRNHLLFDNLNEEYKSKDEGFITRRRLNKKETQQACDCLLSTCTVALKFK